MTPPIPDGFVESGAALPGIGPLYARTSGETALGFAVTAEHCEAGRLIPALQAGFAAHAGEDFVRGLVAPDRAPGLVSLTNAFFDSVKRGQWVEGTARLVRRTRALIFARIELRADGRTVMTAEGIWRAEPAKPEKGTG